MQIQSMTTSVQQATIAYSKTVSTGEALKTEHAAEQATDAVKDSWQRSNENTASATYSRPPKKLDDTELAALMEESATTYKNMRNFVDQMLKEQGASLIAMGKRPDISPQNGSNGETNTALEALEGILTADGKTPLDGMTPAAAVESTEDEWSAENVSDRILEFAKSLVGDDKSKISLLRDAIEEGFRQATKAWGDEMPDITNQTYDLIQSKLDKWESGDEESTGTDSVA